jgi:hypothetical protein
VRSRNRLLVCAAAVATAALVVSAAGAFWGASTAAGPVSITTGHLATPTNLRATTTNCKPAVSFTVTFTWTASNPTAGISGYEIDAATTTGGPYTYVLATVPGATTATYAYTVPDSLNYWGITSYIVIHAIATSPWLSPNSAEVVYRAPSRTTCT